MLAFRLDWASILVCVRAVSAPLEPLVFPVYPDEFRLQTARLLLRAPTLDDAPGLWPLMSDMRLTTFLAWDAHCSPQQTHCMLAALADAQQAGRAFHWLVTRSDLIIGLVSLIDVHRRHRCWTLDRAELAYWIGVPYQGLGYATEAARAVVNFGFHNLMLHKVRVFHAADNPLSGRTIAKLGFRLVGEEKDAFEKDGAWHHLRHFELLVSEVSKIPVALTS